MNDNILTNCPKCGNPLVPGTKSCPVCGTSLEAQPMAPVQPGMEASQTPPVAPLQMPSVEPTTPPQVAANPTVGDFAPPIQTAPQPNAIPSVSNPTISSVNDSSIPTLTPGIVQEAPTKKGKKLNNKVLIIALVVVLVLVGCFVLLNSSGKSATNVNTATPTVEENAETKDVVANGYSFKIEVDWKVQSNSDNTVITNNNENVIIKLENYSFNLGTLSQEMLAARFVDMSNDYNPNKIIVNDVDITETKIASKDAYIVNAKVTESDGKQYATQYYFINGGSDLVVGASVVYTTEEAKTNYEAKVTTLLNNLSFVNDSNSVISTINKNSQAFSVYFSAINGVTLQIPGLDDEEQYPEGEENIEQNISGDVVNDQVVDNQVVDNYGDETTVVDDQFEVYDEGVIG